MMRVSAKEPTNVSVRRRLRFIRCSVCAKIAKTQKLSQHMKHAHRMKPSGADSEILMICPEHQPVHFINVKRATTSQIKDFVRTHGSHLKERRKLTRQERKQVDDLFNQEFGPGGMDPDLAEVFEVSSDENSIPPPPKQVTRPKLNYNVDLDATTSPVPGPSPHASSLADIDEIRDAVATILPPETTNTPEFDALREATKPIDINALIDSTPLQVPLETLQFMLFTDPKPERPGELQQEYINTFVPGLVNPPTSEAGVMSSPLSMKDTSVGTPPPARMNMFTQTTPTTTSHASTSTFPLSVTDAAVDPSPFLTREKAVGDSNVQTADMATSMIDEAPVLENSYDYIRSLNDMKNQMIRQLLEDNIAMAETKQNSRLRALRHLDAMMALNQQDREHVNPYDVSTMDMFSDIFKVKERFIHRLLHENVHSHPEHYKLYELLKSLR